MGLSVEPVASKIGELPPSQWRGQRLRQQQEQAKLMQEQELAEVRQRKLQEKLEERRQLLQHYSNYGIVGDTGADISEYVGQHDLQQLINRNQKLLKLPPVLQSPTPTVVLPPIRSNPSAAPSASDRQAAPTNMSQSGSSQSERDRRYQARQAELQSQAQRRKNQARQAYLDKLFQERQASNMSEVRRLNPEELQSNHSGKFGLTGPLQPIMIPERENSTHQYQMNKSEHQEPAFILAHQLHSSAGQTAGISGQAAKAAKRTESSFVSDRNQQDEVQQHGKAAARSWNQQGTDRSQKAINSASWNLELSSQEQSNQKPAWDDRVYESSFPAITPSMSTDSDDRTMKHLDHAGTYQPRKSHEPIDIDSQIHSGLFVSNSSSNHDQSRKQKEYAENLQRQIKQKHDYNDKEQVGQALFGPTNPSPDDRRKRQKAYAEALQQQIRKKSADTDKEQVQPGLFGPSNQSDDDLKRKQQAYAEALQQQIKQKSFDSDKNQVQPGLFGFPNPSDDDRRRKQKAYGEALQQQIKQKSTDTEKDHELPESFGPSNISPNEQKRKKQDYAKALEDQIKQKQVGRWQDRNESPPGKNAHYSALQEHNNRSEKHESIRSAPLEFSSEQNTRLKKEVYAKALQDQIEREKGRRQRSHHAAERSASPFLNVGERPRDDSKQKKFEYAQELQAQIQEQASNNLKNRDLEDSYSSARLKSEHWGSRHPGERKDYQQGITGRRVGSVNSDSALTGCGERERQQDQNRKREEYARELQKQIEAQRQKKKEEDEMFVQQENVMRQGQHTDYERFPSSDRQETRVGLETELSRMDSPVAVPREENSESSKQIRATITEQMKKRTKAEEYRLALQQQVEARERQKQEEKAREAEEEAKLMRKIEKENEEIARQIALEKAREQAQKRRALEAAAVAEESTRKERAKRNPVQDSAQPSGETGHADRAEQPEPLLAIPGNVARKMSIPKIEEHQKSMGEIVDGKRIIDEMKSLTDMILCRQADLEKRFNTGLESLSQQNKIVHAVESGHALQHAEVDQSIVTRSEWIPAPSEPDRPESADGYNSMPDPAIRSSLASLSKLVYEEKRIEEISEYGSQSDPDDCVSEIVEEPQHNDNIIEIEAKPDERHDASRSHTMNIDTVYERNQLRLKALAACKQRSTEERIVAYLKGIDACYLDDDSDDDDEIDNQSMVAETRWLASDPRHRRIV